MEKENEANKKIRDRYTILSYIEEMLLWDNMIIALCDVDYFANINAKVGIEEGDRILWNIQEFYINETSGNIGHYDEDAFIFAFQKKEIDSVLSEINLIRKKQRRQKFIQHNELYRNVPISSSWGIITAKKDENLKDVLKKVETALFMAKKKGRNCIEVFEKQPLLYLKDKENFVSTVCGSRLSGYSGDGKDAWNAQIVEPYGISVGEEGELYIVDRGNHCIRKVDSLGVISTVAGCGKNGYSGDEGNATSATLCKPSGVAYATGGLLYIITSRNF